MDHVDRMFRHLVRTIRSRYPQYLAQPFDVAELHQTILPYRHHRRELGIDTNEDYEIALTELLSGARDYLIVDDRMRDALVAELASVNPDPSAFKRFPNATVALSPSAVRTLEVGPNEDAASRPALAAAAAPVGAAPIRATGHASTAPPVPLTPSRTSSAVQGLSRSSLSGAPRVSESLKTAGSGPIVPQAGERCSACDLALPIGRPITFCPHCGQNLTTIHCPACGSELEIDWKFCTACGRPAAAPR